METHEINYAGSVNWVFLRDPLLPGNINRATPFPIVAYAFCCRARVKSGVRLLEASVGAAATAWNISVDINPRHTGATVTLVRREPPDADEDAHAGE